MTRILKGIAIPWLFLLGVAAASDTAVEAPELSLRGVMWRAVIRTLEERGMTIQTASEEKGLIITEFASLKPEDVSAAVNLSDQDQGVKWARAEYRYLIGIGVGSDHAQQAQEKERLLIKAEIWAWQQDLMPSPEAKRALQSNYTLEKEFLQAFTSALGRVAEKQKGGS